MLRFYGDLLWRAFLACPSLISGNWAAVVFSAGVALLAFWFDVREQFYALRTWRERGRAMSEKKNIWNAVRALFYGCVLLFFCSIIKTIYDDHQLLLATEAQLAADKKEQLSIRYLNSELSGQVVTLTSYSVVQKHMYIEGSSFPDDFSIYGISIHNTGGAPVTITSVYMNFSDEIAEPQSRVSQLWSRGVRT